MYSNSLTIYINNTYEVALLEDITNMAMKMAKAASYYVPEMYLIDPAQGNSDADEFYEYSVQNEVLARLDSMGITSEALVFGNGL